MNCKIFFGRIIPFSLTLILSLLVVKVLHTKFLVTDNQATKVYCRPFKLKEGIGISGGDYGKDFKSKYEKDQRINHDIKPLKILFKQRANYTDVARQNQIQGTVRLRVRFLASGQIGSIDPVKSLPDGLTEQAMRAASQIRFEPRTVDGKPVNNTAVVEYNFDIY